MDLMDGCADTVASSMWLEEFFCQQTMRHLHNKVHCCQENIVVGDDHVGTTLRFSFWSTFDWRLRGATCLVTAKNHS